MKILRLSSMTGGIKSQLAIVGEEIDAALKRGGLEQFEVVGIIHKTIYSYCERVGKARWELAFEAEARKRKLHLAFRRSVAYTEAFFDGYKTMVNARSLMDDKKRQHSVVTVDADAARAWFEANADTVRREVRAWERALEEA